MSFVAKKTKPKEFKIKNPVSRFDSLSKGSKKLYEKKELLELRRNPHFVFAEKRKLGAAMKSALELGYGEEYAFAISAGKAYEAIAALNLGFGPEFRWAIRNGFMDLFFDAMKRGYGEHIRTAIKYDRGNIFFKHFKSGVLKSALDALEDANSINAFHSLSQEQLRKLRENPLFVNAEASGFAEQMYFALELGFGEEFYWAIPAGRASLAIVALQKGLGPELRWSIKQGYGKEFFDVIAKGYGDYLKAAIKEGKGYSFFISFKNNTLDLLLKFLDLNIAKDMPHLMSSKYLPVTKALIANEGKTDLKGALKSIARHDRKASGLNTFDRSKKNI